MVHRAVVGEFLSYFFVGRQFVSHQVRLAADRCDDLFAKRFGFDIGDMKRTAFPVTLDEGKYGVFFRLPLRIGAVLCLAADETFVRLYNLAFATDRRRPVWRHAFADTVAKEPAAFICDPEHARELERAHALLASGHEMIG